MAKKRIDSTLEAWIAARKRYRLSHAHVQMARELGMNPKKLGGLANHDQEPWKLPLPEFIAELYMKRFGRAAPEVVTSVEARASAQRRKQAERKARRRAARGENDATSGGAAQ